MSTNDTEYYRLRASQERRLAAKARESNVAGLHLQLAKNYEDLAEQSEPRPGQCPVNQQAQTTE